MSLKGLAFIGLFFLCVLGALRFPCLGVYGYIADYCIGPAGQWWEAPFSGLGLRYSFTLAAATAIGLLIQKNKLRWQGSLLNQQEFLLLFFLAIIWFSVLIGDKTIGRYSTADHPTVKFTKAVVFILMMTHIITDRKKFDGLMWVFVFASLILGLQSWDVPRSAFVGGRLEGIGGPDFAESNFSAAFMAGMLPIIGVQLLRSKWYGKIFCAVSAAFTANAIVLFRSRGSFLGLVVGCVMAFMWAPKRHRKKIFVLIMLAMIGGMHVVDPQFLERIATIDSSSEERDESAGSRLKVWAAGVHMLKDNPLGIGAGNWYQTIVQYVPEYEGRDSHSTYVKCAAELGIQGIAFFGVILMGDFFQIMRIRKLAKELPLSEEHDFMLFSFAILIAGVTILTCALTITMIYTEIIWIMIMLPMCLERAVQNAIADHQAGSSQHLTNESV